MADFQPAPNVWDVRRSLDENFSSVAALLKEMEVIPDPKIRLAVAAELRQHLSLAERSLRSLSKAEAIQAYQDIVIEAMRLETPEAHIRLVERIHEMGTAQEPVRPS